MTPTWQHDDRSMHYTGEDILNWLVFAAVVWFVLKYWDTMFPRKSRSEWFDPPLIKGALGAAVKQLEEKKLRATDRPSSPAKW